MTDLLPLGKIHGVFPDVGGQIGHSLQIPADQQEFERGRDDLRVAHHVGQQRTEDALVLRVDIIVGLPHGAAEDACGASQGGEAGEKAVQSPLPKFLVLRPGFEGQCACEIRVLPRLEMEVDEAQALLLEQWRQPSEVKAKSLNLKP